MERLHTLVYLAFLAFVLFVVAQAADATGIASKGLPPEPASTPEPAVRRRGTCKAIPKLSRGNCGSGRFAKADGKQHPDIPTCSKTQMGQIPDAKHMPTTVILKPQDQSTVTAKRDFEISVAVHNLATGFFSDPEIQYYLGAQQLNAEGVIMGHCHVTVQAVPKNPTFPPDPTNFAFFKGLNDVAKNGILTVNVTGGLDAGFYRLCTLCSSFTHQPTLMPVAKRGAQDDCIRFNVS